MVRQPLSENLIDELVRLVGRPFPVVQAVLSRLMAVAGKDLPSGLGAELAVYPLTAWLALAPEEGAVKKIWNEVMEVGLTTEEVFTALAVVDDHVRRRYGNDAWQRVPEWAPGVVHRYNLAGPVGPDARGAGFPAF